MKIPSLETSHKMFEWVKCSNLLRRCVSAGCERSLTPYLWYVPSSLRTSANRHVSSLSSSSFPSSFLFLLFFYLSPSCQLSLFYSSLSWQSAPARLFCEQSFQIRHISSRASERAEEEEEEETRERTWGETRLCLPSSCDSRKRGEERREECEAEGTGSLAGSNTRCVWTQSRFDAVRRAQTS